VLFHKELGPETDASVAKLIGSIPRAGCDWFRLQLTRQTHTEPICLWLWRLWPLYNVESKHGA